MWLSSWFIIYLDSIFALSNLDGWFGVLSNKFIIFDITLLKNYINLRSGIIFCIYSGHIYPSLAISLSYTFVIASG